MNSMAWNLPLVKALGWALVHFLWEGALIALFLSMILPACRSAKARYATASVTMLVMLAAFAITLTVSIPRPAPALALPEIPLGAGPIVGAGFPDPAPLPVNRFDAALPWLVSLWTLGAFLIGVYRLGGWIEVERIRRKGAFAAPSEWQERVAALARRIGISSPVKLLESSLAEVPLVIGFLRPVILVPAGLLANLPASHVEAILLHELAHIRRLDYLANLAQTVAETLLFYHPAMWWVSGMMRAERENCCDDVAVEVQGDAHAYATALVALEERRSPGREPALAATGGNLVRRVRRLLNPPEPPRTLAALVVSMGVLLGLFCFLAAAQQNNQNPPKKAPAPAPTESQPQSERQKKMRGSALRKELAEPYRKWADEDVVYIITSQERVAFNSLQTDQERENFIEQFWLQRDPTPGTVQNEFKEEHYRRIAYTNDHFVWLSHPGWTSDRGRIYIMYGPPDELENHPPDNQQWLYHHIEGVGNNVIIEFVDPQHTGEFQMTKDPKQKAALANANRDASPRPSADDYRKWLRGDVDSMVKNEIANAWMYPWLNGDVAYIITDRERAEFKQLKTSSEQKRFIEQFWLRRDPTPGTARNEFKEEHYRRIGYANEHFAWAAGHPGWTTDRGRVYIVYGPPDEIEDHPREFQQWLYHHIQGVGENVIIDFVDAQHTGEFQMTRDPTQKGKLKPLEQGPQKAMFGVPADSTQSHVIFLGVMVARPADAKAIADTLRSMGLPALVNPGPGNGDLMRVPVGPFEDMATTNRVKTALEHAGFRGVQLMAHPSSEFHLRR
jgi:GWxTD domain-containing protein